MQHLQGDNFTGFYMYTYSWLVDIYELESVNPKCLQYMTVKALNLVYMQFSIE